MFRHVFVCHWLSVASLITCHTSGVIFHANLFFRASFCTFIQGRACV
jgi:hypothetical protein